MGYLDTSFDGYQDADDEETRMAPAAYLQDSSADPAMVLESADSESNDTLRLQDALENLDERSRDILQQRWLNDQKLTLHDLAAKYQVSAERIRQLESAAMKKIKQAILTA